MAFPSNDFHQELGSNQEIQDFVSEKFDDVNFPIFALSSLKDNIIYQQLQRQNPDFQVQHNFFKYLVDRNGQVVKFFHKKQDPLTLTDEIEKLLDARGSRQHKLVTQ